MMTPTSFIGFRNFLFLKASLLGLGLSMLAYALDEPVGGPSGGSRLGYSLGVICTLLILWLMWIGMRKRSYQSSCTPLSGWLSAHVYVGCTLLLLVPLHSGFQLGWNVHTLAYVLMSAVIASGMIGVYFYAVIPAQMTRNRPGIKLEGLLKDVADLDSECRLQSEGLPDQFALIVSGAIEETRIGGGLFQQLSGDTSICAATVALKEMRTRLLRASVNFETRDQILRIIELLGLKQSKLARIRRDIRYQVLLNLWLMFHVPLSFAALAAVAIHIFVVFYHW